MTGSSHRHGFGAHQRRARLASMREEETTMTEHPRAMPHDRSVAFTLLLETDPEFGKLEVNAALDRVTEFLNAWYANHGTPDEVTMSEFAGAGGAPRRTMFLHNHYAANATVAGHEASCKMVTEYVNWPTMSGRPACTCRVGGNTADAQVAWRERSRHGHTQGDGHPYHTLADWSGAMHDHKPDPAAEAERAPDHRDPETPAERAAFLATARPRRYAADDPANLRYHD